MNSNKYILNAIAIVSAMTFSSTATMAHSNHDHSTAPYKWELSKGLKDKVQRKLSSVNPTASIGLNHFEQKKMNHYEIKVGNKFYTEVIGINFLIERTSAGMKIVDATRIEQVSQMKRIPLSKIKMATRTFFNPKNHIGHNHVSLPYEWTFGSETQSKIINGFSQKMGSVFVGLNNFEQSLLKNYDIRPGNTFQTSIAGQRFLVERTSSGLKVINHVEVDGVAMVHSANSRM